MVKEIQEKKWNQSITFKVVISVLIPFLFMSIAFMLILIFSVKYWSIQTEKGAIDRFMSGYSKTLHKAFNLSDFEYIKASIKDIGQMDDLHNIGLFNIKGDPIVTPLLDTAYIIGEARGIAEKLSQWDSGTTTKTIVVKKRGSDPIMHNITVLFNKGDCVKCHRPDKEPILGFFIADFSAKRLNREIYIYIILVISATIVSLIVMIIIIRIVLRKMIKYPLEKINRCLKGVTIISGKIKQIQFQSQDEIGELVDIINCLAERQKYIQQELTSFYEGSYESICPLDYEMNVLASKRVNDVVEKDIEVMYHNMTLKDVLDFMKRSTHTFFPVTDEIGQYKGVIRLQDIRGVLMEPSKIYARLAKEFLKKDVPILTGDDNLKKAMDIFNSENVSYIPVVEEETMLFIGILARRRVLEILKQGFLNSVGI